MSNVTKILIATVMVIFLFVSCSSTETIITDKKISISVPAIKESMPAAYRYIPKITIDSLEKIFSELPDSAYIEAVRKSDPKARIKYYPKQKYFDLDIPAQKVDTTFRDTSKISIKKQTTTAEKFGYGAIGVIVCVVIVGGILIAIKAKVF